MMGRTAGWEGDKHEFSLSLLECEENTTHVSTPTREAGPRLVVRFPRVSVGKYRNICSLFKVYPKMGEKSSIAEVKR